jgi:hypothetical protein
MASEKGFTLLEVLFVAGWIVLMTAIAIPPVLGSLDDWRTLGAAHYVSSRLHQTRMEAVARTAHTALRFMPAGGTYAYAVYVDGNRNGVLSRDIQDGIDREVQRRERLFEQFPGVDFGALPGLPPVDPASPPPGDDPVRFGASDMVTFTPLGTSSPGSVYIKGRRDAQYVVRVFGTTGKIRILRFNPRSGTWKQL